MEKIDNKGLQKLTVSELLKSKVITIEDFESLDSKEQKELKIICNEKLSELTGEKRDEFIKRIWEITPSNSRNNLWESNHHRIIIHLHNEITNNRYIPTIGKLEELTGLSRQTVSKHLKEYKQSQLCNEYKETFQMLSSQVMRTVYSLAIQGDIRACKLYFEAIGELNSSKTSTYIDKQQNNHHTENNILTPEMIKDISDKLEREY